jgi:predicted RNase H-like nuclease (RuvC/YqgF family)
MVLNNKNTNDIIYSSEVFEIKTELKSDKKLIIEGFISTSKPDSNNEVVTKQGQINLVKQIKDRMAQGNHITMDLDHETFRNSKGKMEYRLQDKIPVALIQDVELIEEGDVTKTKVKAIINDAHPLYPSIKKSIENKFLHSFSIAYRVTQDFFKKINGVTTRYLEGLTLRNVGITGVPVNGDATFEVSLKSYLKKMEENTQFDSLNESITELKSSIENKDLIIEELKSKLENTEKTFEDKINNLNIDELKSTIDELKSKAIHKAPVNLGEVKKNENFNVFSLM